MRCGLISVVLAGIALIQSPAHAQSVLLLRASGPMSAEESQVKELVDFLGLKLETYDVESSASFAQLIPRFKHLTILGIVASAEILPLLSRDIQLDVDAKRRVAVPMLIYGVGSGTDAKALRYWSEGQVDVCTMVNATTRPNALRVFSVAGITGSLSGLELPAVSEPTCRMQVSGNPTSALILATTAANQTSPVLVRVLTRTGQVFFLPQLHDLDRSWVGEPWSLPYTFSSLSPFLLPLKNMAGEYGWHLDGHYANFTIDDPWLAERYGNLDYAELLLEMEKHNFHTTIAFVPWNFDRSDAKVARLFRDNPERYSISIHGNNHAHREFGDYSRNSLVAQTRDIDQAVARMEKFRELTGVPYDRVMVFPHGVAPLATFAALSEAAFLGTANSLNVPLNEKTPMYSTYLLRPYTTRYADLLSFSRYSVEAPLSHSSVAIQAFMGNPIMLYAHEGFFRDGITAFNPIAEDIHRMQPDTQWEGLGKIARHSYEIRRRSDGAFDVRMSGREVELSNRSLAPASYFVTFSASSLSRITGVTIDGTPQPISRTHDVLTLRLEIPANQSRTLRAALAGDADLSQANIGKTDLHLYAIRALSDFRDMYLSNRKWGRTLVDQYYGLKADSFELLVERVRWLPVVLFAIVVGCCLVYSSLKRRRQIKVPSTW